MEYPINKSQVCLIDLQDYDYVSQFKWYVENGYAVRYVKGKRKRMHRELMNARPGHIIDHANCNRLDNRRMNLRFVTHKENAMNRSINKHSASGYKGVSWNKSRSKWLATIQVGGQLRYLGMSASKEGAAELYNAAAVAQFGQYANLNAIPDMELAT